MKTLTLITLSSLLVAGAVSAQVEVVFEDPESFRDIDYGHHNTQRGIKVHLPQIEKHIQKQAKRFLEEGQTLSMTITDLDLAGDYEPWRSPSWDDVRIVKSIYPPRIQFTYELKDAEGNVLSSGEEKITDIAFEYRVRLSSYDELFYDKAMITDWMRKMVREVNKG